MKIIHKDKSGHKDHDIATHQAKCDQEGCEYIAKVHAHDDEWAVVGLSEALAKHNESIHKIKTDPDKIHDAVKLKTLSLD